MLAHTHLQLPSTSVVSSVFPAGGAGTAALEGDEGPTEQQQLPAQHEGGQAGGAGAAGSLPTACDGEGAKPECGGGDIRQQGQQLQAEQQEGSKAGPR